eukprot:4848465-Pyramimonas_sp.AAC.1
MLDRATSPSGCTGRAWAWRPELRIFAPAGYVGLLRPSAPRHPPSSGKTFLLGFAPVVVQMHRPG